MGGPIGKLGSPRPRRLKLPQILDHLRFGPVPVAAVGLGEKRTMAAIFSFEECDVGVVQNLAASLRENADKRIVRGVQDEGGDADVVENVSGSGAVVIVISAGKATI